MHQQRFLSIVDESTVDPSILVWPGDPNHPMPTLQQAYDAGHRNGLNWPKDRPGWQHLPGGPWSHGELPRGHRLERQARHSVAARSEWLRGWHAGFKQQCSGRMPPWYRPFDRFA